MAIIRNTHEEDDRIMHRLLRLALEVEKEKEVKPENIGKYENLLCLSDYLRSAYPILSTQGKIR